MGYPTEWWFPTFDKGVGSRPARDAKEDAAVAMRICTELCAVRAECLVHALRHREMGLWGGTTEEERRGIRARPRRGEAA